MNNYLIYTGKGKGTIPDVPARNLSYEEAKKYGIIELLKSGLYEYNSDQSIPNEYRDDLGLKKHKPKRKQTKESE